MLRRRGRISLGRPARPDYRGYRETPWALRDFPQLVKGWRLQSAVLAWRGGQKGESDDPEIRHGLVAGRASRRNGPALDRDGGALEAELQLCQAVRGRKGHEPRGA